MFTNCCENELESVSSRMQKLIQFPHIRLPYSPYHQKYPYTYLIITFAYIYILIISIPFIVFSKNWQRNLKISTILVIFAGIYHSIHLMRKIKMYNNLENHVHVSPRYLYGEGKNKYVFLILVSLLTFISLYLRKLSLSRLFIPYLFCMIYIQQYILEPMNRYYHESYLPGQNKQTNKQNMSYVEYHDRYSLLFDVLSSFLVIIERSYYVIMLVMLIFIVGKGQFNIFICFLWSVILFRISIRNIRQLTTYFDNHIEVEKNQFGSRKYEQLWMVSSIILTFPYIFLAICALGMDEATFNTYIVYKVKKLHLFYVSIAVLITIGYNKWSKRMRIYYMNQMTEVINHQYTSKYTYTHYIIQTFSILFLLFVIICGCAANQIVHEEIYERQNGLWQFLSANQIDDMSQNILQIKKSYIQFLYNTKLSVNIQTILFSAILIYTIYIVYKMNKYNQIEDHVAILDANEYGTRREFLLFVLSILIPLIELIIIIKIFEMLGIPWKKDGIATYQFILLMVSGLTYIYIQNKAMKPMDRYYAHYSSAKRTLEDLNTSTIKHDIFNKSIIIHPQYTNKFQWHHYIS